MKTNNTLYTMNKRQPGSIGRNRFMAALRIFSLAGMLAFGLTAAQAQYDSTGLEQNTKETFPGMTNAHILRMNVITTGGTSVLQAMRFSTSGTTDAADILTARLYYSAAGSFTAPITGTLLGTINAPNGNFNFTGLSFALATGNNNFWLVYDVNENATTSNVLDAQCISLDVSGITQIPDVQDPAGSRSILPHVNYSYCAYPSLNAGNYLIGISRLEIAGALMQQVIAVAGNVQFHTATILDFHKDVTYPFKYRGGTGNPQQEKIYIDYNNDGFYDVSEVQFQGNTPASTETSGSLYVDCARTKGIRRMRIATDLIAPNGPCGINNYGSSFEIMVRIMDAPAPVAGFTVQDTAYRGAFVPTTNTSAGWGYTYQWDYTNDGSFDATGTNGVNQYSTAGTYTIRMGMGRNFCGTPVYTETTSDVVIVNPPGVPYTEFISDRNVTNASLTVYFKDLSTNGPNKWLWRISPSVIDGNPAYTYLNGTDSTSQNPQVKFLILGKYNVELYSENILGAGQWVSKSEYIHCISILNMCDELKRVDDYGFLADDGGVTGNYLNVATTGKLCALLIEPPCAATISFNFLDFDMSSYQVTNCNIQGSNPPVLQPNDHVRIYDGADESGIPLHVAAGFPNGFSNGPANTPLAQLPPTVTANSGKMYIVYSTNCAFNGRGFLGEWSSSPKGLAAPDVSFTSVDSTFKNGAVLFTNTTKGKVDMQNWDYQNDGTQDAITKDGEFTYTSAGTYTSKLTAYNCGAADVFTKTIVVQDQTKKPVANFEAGRTSLIVNDVIRLFDKSAEGPTAWTWEITPSLGVSFKNGTTANSRFPWVEFSRTGTYSVKLKVSNSFGADSLTKTSYIGVFAYCTPSVLNLSSDVGISRMTFAGIDNSSSIGTQGYTSYTMTGLVERGATYPIMLERNSDFNEVSRKVWIDYNNNGNFADAGEEVLFDPASYSKIFNGNITIPANTLPGRTKMRVAVNTSNNDNLSCGPNDFGEFEDYYIEITPDVTKPAITLLGTTPYFIERSLPYTDHGATAWDNADGDITGQLIIRTNLDTNTTGEYWISFNVTDNEGNKADSVYRKIIVQPDGSGPVITLNVSDSIIHDVKTPFADPSATAEDYVDGNVTNTLQVTGSVNENVLGTYYLTYNAMDLSGNPSTKVRIVTVVDRTAPTMALIGTDPLTIDYGQPFADPGVTINDNFYTGLIATGTGVLYTNHIGDYVITYNVADPSGNQAAPLTRNVLVRDISAPKVTLIGGDTIWVDVKGSFIDPGVIVKDNHTKNLQASVNGTVNEEVTGLYTLEYTATDSSGNTNIAVKRIVKVVDRVAPTLSLKGSSLVQISRWTNYTDAGVNVDDNYSSKTYLQNNLIVSTTLKSDVEGLYEYCYIAVDESGNKSAMACRLVEVGAPNPNGIGEGLAATVKVYPNPNTGNFVIETPTLEDLSIEIFDARGSKVAVPSPAGAGVYHADLSNLGAGVYFVRISSGTESTAIRVVVTQ